MKEIRCADCGEKFYPADQRLEVAIGEFIHQHCAEIADAWSLMADMGDQQNGM